MNKFFNFRNFSNIKSLFLTAGIFFLISLSFINLNAQTTVNIGALKDNTLYEEEFGFISNGAGQYFFAGKTAGDLIRRGVIAFDIAANIPAKATITNVSLTLHMSKTISGSKNINLFKMLQNWGEGTSAPGGEEGFGTAAEPGDATWLHAYYDTTAWDNSEVGGNYSHTVSAVTSVGGVGFYTWGSNSQMIADVQSWVNNPASNAGWILTGDENNLATAKRFDTRQNNNASFRPVLSITYTLSFVTLNLTSFIEGFWDGSSMVSDSVKVYLANSVYPYNYVDSAFKVLSSNGTGTYTFPNAGSGSYYIVLNHRNSIETWSSSAESFTAGVPKNYNFSTNANKAYGDNQVLKSTKYCIYSGDVNKDGIIDASDLSDVENAAANSESGYVPTDLTGDDFVDSSDISLVENNASLSVELIRP